MCQYAQKQFLHVYNHIDNNDFSNWAWSALLLALWVNYSEEPDFAYKYSERLLSTKFCNFSYQM